MSIKSIEIICIPCIKCKDLERKIRELVGRIEKENRIKIPYEFKHTKTLQDLFKYSLSSYQTPAILINGKVEFAGPMNDKIFMMKLETVNKTS